MMRVVRRPRPRPRSSCMRSMMRHRVLRNGKVAGRRRSGIDVWEVQGKDGAARSVDVLYD